MEFVLGKKTLYDSHYDANKLFPITRQAKRAELGIHEKLPFFGYDVWNHYEVSWLNERGKPMVAIAVILYGCDSVSIIESKSMKLYFNTFNNTVFKDADAVQATIKRDLDARLDGSFISVHVLPLHQFQNEKLYSGLNGQCLDDLEVDCSVYQVDPALLTIENDLVDETLYSDLLKSNCLVTNQPDWCSIQIRYKGKKINHENLLRYIVSFRNTNEFHEHCIEKIFMHLMNYCQPQELTVYGRSTRRGGLDINSYRSTQPVDPNTILNVRLCRQ